MIVFILSVLHADYFNYNATGLKYFWPIWGKLTEVINNLEPNVTFNTGLASDRFGNAFSAISLNLGYLKLPPGVYFAGDFTIMAWVYLRTRQADNPRIFEVSNGPNVDAVSFLVSVSSSSYRPALHICQPGCVLARTSSATLPLNTWTHFAATLSGSTVTLYINGVNSGSTSGVMAM